MGVWICGYGREYLVHYSVTALEQGAVNLEFGINAERRKMHTFRHPQGERASTNQGVLRPSQPRLVGRPRRSLSNGRAGPEVAHRRPKRSRSPQLNAKPGPWATVTISSDSTTAMPSRRCDRRGRDAERSRRRTGPGRSSARPQVRSADRQGPVRSRRGRAGAGSGHECECLSAASTTFSKLRTRNGLRAGQA